MFSACGTSYLLNASGSQARKATSNQCYPCSSPRNHVNNDSTSMSGHMSLFTFVYDIPQMMGAGIANLNYYGLP